MNSRRQSAAKSPICSICSMIYRNTRNLTCPCVLRMRVDAGEAGGKPAMAATTWNWRVPLRSTRPTISWLFRRHQRGEGAVGAGQVIVIAVIDEPAMFHDQHALEPARRLRT